MEELLGFMAIERSRALMSEYDLKWVDLLSVATDGARSMVGGKSGLIHHIQNQNSNVVFYDCIIHQTALCSSSLLSCLMFSTVTSMVNFLRERSSLIHGLFRTYLAELDSMYTDLLLHNNVR